MESTAEILNVLRAMRRRLSVVMFLRHSARATLFFFGLLVVLRGMVWWSGQSRPDPSSLPYMLSWPVVLGVIGGLMITLVRRPSLEFTATVLDQRGNTRDRLASALEFSGRKPSAEMEQLAVQETTAWVKGRDFRPLVPIKFPRELFWLAVPLATLALLFWHEMTRAAQQDAAVAAARENIRGTERSLEALARQLEAQARATESEVLKRVAERLKQSAAQLRSEANKAGDTQAAALREIAALEQLVKQLRQPQAVTPAELNALARALEKNDETREAAKALQENRLADAAKELEKASKQPEAQKAEAALKEAINHLAQQQEQSSKQLEQLQNQAQSGEGQQTLQQVAQMLREQAGGQENAKQGEQGKQGGQEKQKQQAQAGKSMTDQEMRTVLNALQQMKDQQQKDEEKQDGPPGEKSGQGSGGVKMMSFAESPTGKPSSELGMPTGLPGSEKDPGTTKDPFGAATAAPGEAKRQEQLAGQLGEGESLSALIPSAAGGEAKAAKRYKELTEAAAAAAEDAVLQEEIPLGSRFLIKRYFEAIRARE